MAARGAKRPRTDDAPKRYSKSQWKNFKNRMAYVEYKNYGYPKHAYKRYFPRTEESAARYGPSLAGASEEQVLARHNDQMIGRGRYGVGRAIKKFGRRKDVRRFTRGLLHTGMGAVTGRAAGLMGGGMYAGAHRALGGSGEYTAPLVNLSDELHGGQYFGKPLFSADGVDHDSGGLVISNQEYIQTIYGNPSGENFVSQTFSVNPGLAEVFPMLSQFANNFDNYEMLQCAFHYETLLDEGVFQSSTGQVGDILMYSHMNPDEVDLQNVSEFIQAGGHISRATKGCVSGVECDADQMSGLDNAGLNRVRYMPVESGNTDDYDQAKFQFAVSNTPSTLADQPIGRLYVSYTVRLIKPKISTLIGRSQLCDQFTMLEESIDVPTNEPFPVVATANAWRLQKNTIGCSLDYSAPTSTKEEELRITFPSWLQGLVKVTLFTNLIGEPDTVAELGGRASLVGVVETTGNVSSVDAHIFATSATASGAVSTIANTIGIGKDGDKCHGAFAVYLRLSLPDSGDNTVTLSMNGTDSAASGTVTIGSIKTALTIETVQDYEAVGSAALDNETQDSFTIGTF
jgi:hypothetical protein